MSLLGKFYDNARKLGTKTYAALALAAAPVVLAPTESKAQSNKYDGRYWAFSTGVAITSNDKGAESSMDVNFDFHATTPGFGNENTFIGKHNWFAGGARLAGSGQHAGGAYKQTGHIGYMGWYSKQNAVYLSWMLGQEVNFGNRNAAIVAFDNTFNMYAGGNDNVLNLAHYTGGIRAQANINIFKGLGLELSVVKGLFQVRNKNVFSNYLLDEDPNGIYGLASYKQVNPDLTIKAGLSYKF